MDIEMLKSFLSAYGPSGREEPAAEVIKSYIAPAADEVYTDTLGNLIALKRGTNGKKIMISAHMDQIGLIVVEIDEQGFLRLSNVGGVNPSMAFARNVVFKNGVRGVIGRETKDKGPSPSAVTELFCDIGASSREEAAALVSVGDLCVFVSPFTEMNGRISCGAMDDRLCCFAVAEAFLHMESSCDVYAVFTVQEEVGLRGAAPAAYGIMPDLVIDLDVTPTGDTPNGADLNAALGKGVAIKAMDSSVIVPEALRRYLTAVCEECGIPCQQEVLRAGGTDTGAFQRVREGILAGCLSIPTRYVHSPVETADLRDVQAAIDLLLAVLRRGDAPTSSGRRA